MARVRAQPWTAAQIKLLRQLLDAGKTDEEIGEVLGRSWQAIESKRLTMNLKRHVHRLPAGSVPWQNTKMILTDWEDLGNGVRRRLLYRADDAGLFT